MSNENLKEPSTKDSMQEEPKKKKNDEKTGKGHDGIKRAETMLGDVKDERAARARKRGFHYEMR